MKVDGIVIKKVDLFEMGRNCLKQDIFVLNWIDLFENGLNYLNFDGNV